MKSAMELIDRAVHYWKSRGRPRRALALAGGGVIGGMYQVGAMAALEERLPGHEPIFDVYVGCSAGSVVASLLANGVRASEIYRVLDGDLDDPLNFRTSAVFAAGALRRAAGRFGRLVWALGRSAVRGSGTLPDIIAHAADLPAGFFSLAALEAHMRRSFESRGLSNSFDGVKRRLLIPAVDLDTAERVVFGQDGLTRVPISHAVAASSAIPGFFDPYTIDGRHYVDGGVGWSGHADLAAEAGASVVLVVNPLVPNLARPGDSVRTRGVYTIMEQASRIYSQNLLTLGLTTLGARFPRAAFHLLEPPRDSTLLFGPSMGFEAARAALRFGYESTRQWLAGPGTALVRRLGMAAVAAG
jgi:predicted acylesterase/phospholipase RssA